MTPKEYNDVRESFVIALEGEGVDSEVITRVVDKVDDYVDNHYDPDAMGGASFTRKI